MAKKYKIHKTPARYNIRKVDTYRVLYNAGKVYCQGIGYIEQWDTVSDKFHFSIEDAEKELAEFKGKAKLKG